MSGGPLPGRRDQRWLTLLTLCIAVLVAQLDTSVVNLGVRPIGEYFQARLGTLQWVVDSYNLLYAVLLLTGGLLADLYGRRLVFMSGAAIFAAASLLCALSPSIMVLIGGRAIAGVGAALLLPASLAIIRVVWPEERERARALGIWASCNGVALAIGPTAGGLLIDWFGWRSLFFVVVPVAVAAVVLAALVVPETSDPEDRHFDAPAQVFGALALGGLAVAAIESHDEIGIAFGAVVIAALALVLFIRVEARRGGGALVPLELFRVRKFFGAVAATTGMTFGMYGVLFLLPLFWQSAGRLDPVGAGIALMPSALVFVLVSPLSGYLSGRFGSRAMAAGGVAIIGLGLLLIAATARSASMTGTEIGLALTGLGMGLATGPLMGTAVGAVAPARAGTAAALINVARMAGATIGVAVLGAAYAFAEGGPDGVRLALQLGGMVQLVAAGTAWVAMRRRARR